MRSSMPSLAVMERSRSLDGISLPLSLDMLLLRLRDIVGDCCRVGRKKLKIRTRFLPNCSRQKRIPMLVFMDPISRKKGTHTVAMTTPNRQKFALGSMFVMPMFMLVET